MKTDGLEDETKDNEPKEDERDDGKGFITTDNHLQRQIGRKQEQRPL